MAPVAKYSANAAGVTHVRALIDARRYVLDSDRGDVQPVAAQNASLERHGRDEYGAHDLLQHLDATSA